MAPFDYTTVPAVFAYGNSAGTATDPVNEAGVMASLVTAMSRAADVYCNQILYSRTAVQDIVPALIDSDGVLTCWPATPTIASITAADWRASGAATWAALDPAAIDIEESKAGCTVRLLGRSVIGYRGSRLRVRLSYTGGWANLAAVPSDFEWAMRSLCWWAYQKRSAPSDKTAIPDLGVLIIPQAWPPNVKAMFKNYVRQVPM